MTWWHDNRPIYWIKGWRWGWMGNGWNGLFIGKIVIWFDSGPSPLTRMRLHRIVSRKIG